MQVTNDKMRGAQLTLTDHLVIIVNGVKFRIAPNGRGFDVMGISTPAELTIRPRVSNVITVQIEESQG